ncbi:ABC transporter substrate-binding protein [Leifsonia sp. AG29]|uniref:ABC transporter substrate-binding protein n=1 Tax=Leifsonia sp. AG29 TaxID=2598860 RepID=UPI00131BFD26|nr:ABC transporter substrate-binding protein [Leifsonia sp. AG29]
MAPILRTPLRLTVATIVLAALSATVAGCSSEGAAQPAASGASSSAVTVDGVKISVDAAARKLVPQRYLDSAKVEVASDVPYAPFEFFTADGSDKITGVDYDLGQAIGAKLGLAFEFKQQTFDGIIPAMQAGKFQAAMSAMTSSVARMDVLDFVDYSASGTGILVAKGNPQRIKTFLDLCGKAVAAQSGSKQVDLVNSWQAKCSTAGKKPIALSQFPKDSDGQLAITSGKVVASVATKPSAGYVAKSTNGGKTFQVIDDPAAPTGYDSTLNGIGVVKGDKLAEAVRAALQSLMDDGTYKKILDHYGVAGIAIPKATINGAAK